MSRVGHDITNTEMYRTQLRTPSYTVRPMVRGLLTILMLMTHAPETGARNRRQKTGVGFWRQFFTPVAKFLAPETNTDE